MSKKNGICFISSPSKKDKKNGYKGCLSERVKSIQVLKLYSDEVDKADEQQMCSVLRQIDPNKFSSIEYRPDYEFLLENEQALIDGNVPETLEQLFLSKTQLLARLDDKKMNLVLPIEVYVCGNDSDSVFYKVDYENDKSLSHKIISYSLVKYIMSLDETNEDNIIVYRLIVDGLMEAMYYTDEDNNKVPFLIPMKGNKIVDFVDNEDYKKLENKYGILCAC